MSGAVAVLVALALAAYAAVRVDAAIRQLGARYRHEGQHRAAGRRRWREHVVSRAASGSLAVVAEYGTGHVHRLDAR